MASTNHQHHHHHDHHDHHDGREVPQFGVQGPAAHGDDFTEKNRAHWDQSASKYTEQQWQKDMISQITDFIVAHVEWMGIKSTDRVLDYACGPGTITNALGPRASEYIGIDLSDNMVKAYNARFASEALTAHSVVGDLLTETPPAHLNDPKYFNFDLVVIGLGFHHFENLPLSLSRLSERLKPGGALVIVDLLSHEPEERYKTIVAHHGFNQEAIHKLFMMAGLEDVASVVMEKPVMMHGTKPRSVFMARGRKAAGANL